jgi:hypothetical protein
VTLLRSKFQKKRKKKVCLCPSCDDWWDLSTKNILYVRIFFLNNLCECVWAFFPFYLKYRLLLLNYLNYIFLFLYIWVIYQHNNALCIGGGGLNYIYNVYELL